GVATTVSFDVGGMWRPQNFLSGNFSIGANLSNVGPKISYIDQDQADPLPTNLRLGLAYRIFQDDYNSLTIIGDASKLLVSKRQSETNKDTVITQPSEFRSIEYSAGVEYWYGRAEDFMFAVR
ncbi:MAG: PorV/PorQ family protein, partial [Chlorobi bacterium]|nr:PorV/PorQ family protein [Chlorobiota bacterium]